MVKRSTFSMHLQFPNELIEGLIEKSISIIVIDFAGIRRGSDMSGLPCRVVKKI